jgi:branched-chain amino acid transport system ATP-binding protein
MWSRTFHSGTHPSPGDVTHPGGVTDPAGECAEPPDTAPAVALVDVGKAYGALPVLHGVSFDVATGEVVGIAGANGAGKTTLLDIVAGAQRAHSGRVALAGVDVTRLAPARRARLGLARTLQAPRPMGALTVFEVAVTAASRGAGLRGGAAYAAAGRAVGLAGLTQHHNAAAAALCPLGRKRLELVRALAGQPQVLLLDEISGGLTEAQIAELAGTIQEIHRAGTTIMWAEHAIDVLAQAATRLICLAGGRVLADGPPRDVLNSPSVRSANLDGSGP